MLIKRTERQTRRGTLAAALASQSGSGLDRRSFPAPLRPRCRRSCGASAPCRLPACARPKPAAPECGRRHASARTSARIARSAAPSSLKCQRRVGRPGAGLGQPINRGSHCAKGAATRELVHGDRRLRYPMKLVNGQWTRISWDVAINEIGDKLMEIRGKSGAEFGLLAGLRQVHQRRLLSQSASSRRSGAPTTPITRRASAIRPPSPAWPIPGATAR